MAGLWHGFTHITSFSIAMLRTSFSIAMLRADGKGVRCFLLSNFFCHISLKRIHLFSSFDGVLLKTGAPNLSHCTVTKTKTND